MKPCPRCGSEKDKNWHLVCAACWGRLPQHLRDELYDSWQQHRGTPRPVPRDVPAPRFALRTTYAA